MNGVLPSASAKPGVIATRQRWLSVACLAVALLPLPWLPTHPLLVLAWMCWAVFGWWMLVLGMQVLFAQCSNWLDWRAHAPQAIRPPGHWAALRVWLWACWEAPKVFAWRQPWQAQRWPDLLPDSPRSAEGEALGGLLCPASSGSALRPVLFVHGLVSNRGFWNPWLAQMSARSEPFVAVSISKPFAPLDEQADELCAQVDELIRRTGQTPLIVAHSMGGLVVRAWLRLEAKQGVAWQERVHRVVCLGSPVGGTRLARWSNLPLARQMLGAADGGVWLSQLDADLKAFSIPDALFFCVASNADNMVFPAQSALLPAPAGRQVLSEVPHVPLAQQPQVMAVVLGLR